MGAPGRARTAATVALKRVPAMPARMPLAPPPVPSAEGPAERLDQPLDEDRLRSPQRLEAVDLDLEQPERGIERIGAAGDPRAERRERLEGGLDGRPVRVGIRVDEGRLRDEPMGAPERHPPPDAQRPGFRARVDDRARIPRPAAQDERAGREGLGGSRPGELEGEVRPVEMEESHRGGSVRRSRGLDGGGLVDEEVVAAEAGVALAALRVEDPEGRPPPRRAVAVAGDERLGPLADDVASEPDPRPPGELEAEAGRLGDGGREAAGQARAARARRGASPTRRASAASRPSRSAIRAGLSVAASRPPGRSRTSRSTERPASSAPPMARPSSSVSGRDDHEPFEPDAAGDRLDRVEAARQVEPGHDRARDLGLGGEPEDERRPAARAVAADRDAGRPRQAARPEDRVERREAGVDDAVVGVGPRLGTVPGPVGRRAGRAPGPAPGAGSALRAGASRDPRSCRSPASLEARDGCRHVRGRGSPSDDQDRTSVR